MGEPGARETHLATPLCVAARRQRRRARFTTATAMVNELVEAKHRKQLICAPDRSDTLFCAYIWTVACCGWRAAPVAFGQVLRPMASMRIGPSRNRSATPA
ncbi:MAG: ATP-binding protein [Acidobacteriaceae bacterium]|nr:ATP-binding protein [Acidobacteriaceae bacterium]